MIICRSRCANFNYYDENVDNYINSDFDEYALDETQNESLKVLTNEKRGGLAVVSFDRSRFKLISRKISNKFVQAPSCESPRTAQRTLFLSFESNNCFPITVLCRRLMEKSGKLACHVVNSNIAIGSCRRSKYL
jgi:hypothetical protein